MSSDFYYGLLAGVVAMTLVAILIVNFLPDKPSCFEDHHTP